MNKIKAFCLSTLVAGSTTFSSCSRVASERCEKNKTFIMKSGIRADEFNQMNERVSKKALKLATFNKPWEDFMHIGWENAADSTKLKHACDSTKIVTTKQVLDSLKRAGKLLK